MRKKEVEIDGEKHRIGALTLDQVDEFMAQRPDTAKLDEAAQAAAVQQNAYEMVCNALNNGICGEVNGNKWTPERLKKEIDLKEFSTLHEEILRFSGLIVQKEPAPGEAQAGT